MEEEKELPTKKNKVNRRKLNREKNNSLLIVHMFKKSLANLLNVENGKIRDSRTQ